MVTVTAAAWAQAYLATQAVEVPIYLVAGRALPRRLRWVVAIAASTLTHPLVWFVIPALPWPSYAVYFAGAEGFAVAIEALLLWGVGLRHPLRWALAANAASVAVGLLLRAAIGWP